MKLFGLTLLQPLSKRQWYGGVLLCIGVLVGIIVARSLFTAPAIVNPVAGIAFAGLFLEGVVLWPFVYAGVLIGLLINGSSLTNIVLMPLAFTVQAVLGAYILRRAHIDPLFRRTRDMFWFMGVAIVSSLLIPTVGFLARYINEYAFGATSPQITWISWYVGTVFSVFIVSPFIIRWFVKPRFTRTGLHIFEIVASLSFLSFVGFFLFWTVTPTIGDIPITYLLLFPLFWLALRLRPRFLTLGLVILSVIGIAGAFLGPKNLEGVALGDLLFQIELFMCFIAFIFYILVSLEEERRVTTELTQTQVTSLENAITRLTGEDRAKTEFIAVLAHELRNPLAPVLSTIEFLRLKGSKDKEKVEAFALIEDRMSTVKRLLDDLLDVSRISERKLTLSKEVVDVGTVVRHAALSSDSYFKERHQTLVNKVPEDTFFILGDPVRLEQVFTNLLTNAAKFSNSRERIHVTAQRHEEYVEISVIDRGVGIPPDMQARIFEPFLQIEQGERTRKGIGIGLSLVKSLVELHDGRVWVTSAGTHQGSVFTVSLPLAPEDTVALFRTERGVIHTTPDVPEGRGHILIVDDNDAAGASLGKLLELTGRTVDYAYDGGQAVEKARQTPYDLILLDIGLPDMEGTEVAKEMRLNGYKGKIVALTGYSLDENRRKAQESGFDDFLVKPVGFEELKRILPTT